MADLDIEESSGEPGQPQLAVQVAGDEEEVDRGVGVVAGSALQGAELQGKEVGPATGLHQPDSLLVRAVTSHLSHNTLYSVLSTSPVITTIPSEARLADSSRCKEYTELELELDLVWLQRRRNNKVKMEINIFHIPYFLMFDNILNYNYYKQ